MKISTWPPCELHIFVCVHDREPSTGMPCCARAGGADVYDRFKKRVAERGMSGSVWVTKSGCLGFCNADGATVAAYPSGKMLIAVKPADVDKILP